MPDKSLRDEAAELVTEAVRELRDSEVAEALRDLRAEVEKLRAGQAGCRCHGCTCTHIHWTTYPVPGCAPYQLPQVWYGTVTTTNTSGYVNAASGYNPALTTSYVSN